MDEPQMIQVGPKQGWEPLPDTEIALIHAGLMKPNEQAVRRMAREIRKWRGEEYPDRI